MRMMIYFQFIYYRGVWWLTGRVWCFVSGGAAVLNLVVHENRSSQNFAEMIFFIFHFNILIII